MISNNRATVNLEPDLAAFITELVLNRVYPSNSAAINAAVKMLKRSEEAKARKRPDAQIKRALRMKDNARRR
jgi:Arc/MetJ-type ribon-helix-helix transcriptional regulator